MPNIGDNITLDMPTVGETKGQTYATKINAAIEALRDILEQAVPLSAVDITSDLNMLNGSDYYDIINVNALSMKGNSGAGTTQNRSLYFVGDELYVLDGAGNSIALTASGSATGSTATNGIITTGSPTYNTGGEILQWDGTNNWFAFFDNASEYAKVKVEELHISEDDTYFTKLVSPSGLSADSTITLPEVAASANEILGITSSGVIQASAAGSGFIGYSMVSGEDITFVGGGRPVGHQDVVAIDCASLGHASDNDMGNFDDANYFVAKSGGASTDAWYVYIPMPANTQINSWSLTVDKAGTTQTTADMVEVGSYGSTTAIGAQQTNSSSGQQVLSQSGLTDNLTLNSYFQLGISGGDSGDKFYKLVVTYTHV